MTHQTRLAVVAAIALVAAIVATGPATAAHVKIQGFIGKPAGALWDVHAAPKRTTARPNPFAHVGSWAAPRRLAAACPQPQPDPACNLTYHGGSVVLGPHTTYVVYWEPTGSTVSANYHSLIERYLGDVAAASGRATNVYATDTQYGDGTNTIQYQQTYGGSFVDTTAYPAVAANCATTDGTRTALTCLTQTQESTELDNFIQANSLPRGLDVIYFLVLPRQVETCYDDGSDCGNYLNISPRYCAYHSSFNISGHGLTLWANEPYINIALGHCDSGNRSSPNGDDADHAINALSHEHNETITDPTGAGWFDVDGTGENGDKCNFMYGPSLGSTTNGAYNQLINGHPYEFQQEWSNATTSCESSYGAVDPTASFTSSPASPKALDSVSFDGSGSHSNDTGGTLVSYDWTFGDGGTATGATPSHTYSQPGVYTVTLTVKSDAGKTNAVSHDVTVVKRPTTLSYTGSTTGEYHDSVTVGAQLTDSTTSSALASKSVTFTIGTQTCNGTTDTAGIASCSITLTQTPGTGYTASASFGGDSIYTGSSDSAPFSISKEETTLVYGGPTVILAGSGSTVNVSARLDEDGANDTDGDGGSSHPSPAGQAVTFTLGGQTCTGFVSAVDGIAACAIANVSASTLGSKTLTAGFAGDANYVGSSSTTSVIVFAFPSRGAFALGDATAATAGPTTTVTWWSDVWPSLDALTGGTAPPSFKGFAATPTTLPSKSPATTCGTSFATLPGNSPPPVGDIPSYMGVIVSSSVTKNGSTISGSWSKIVVVRTNPGYATSPGHPGTGTIVATFCG